jgi:hypothetical protein
VQDLCLKLTKQRSARPVTQSTELRQTEANPNQIFLVHIMMIINGKFHQDMFSSFFAEILQGTEPDTRYSISCNYVQKHKNWAAIYSSHDFQYCHLYF